MAFAALLVDGGVSPTAFQISSGGHRESRILKERSLRIEQIAVECDLLQILLQAAIRLSGRSGGRLHRLAELAERCSASTIGIAIGLRSARVVPVNGLRRR